MGNHAENKQINPGSDEWMRQSTHASKVPRKVKDAAVIAALLILVQSARRTTAVTARTRRQK